jgi:ATP-dependent DNA helicase RecG
MPTEERAMLTDSEIADLFRSMESERVERKRDYQSSTDKVRQAICAFANDMPNRRLPGVIFVGQNDDGTCAGSNIDDELLTTLGGLRSDGKILPFPVMTVARHVIDGCAVAVITVIPSIRPPVRLDGRCWIRVGPRRATATPEEERRLAEKQVWQNLAFDARPCGDADLDDLDLVRFEAEYVPSAVSPEIRRQNGRTTEEKLRALRLLSRDGKPTHAAILLFGKDPRAYFAGAYIQFLRLDGPALTDPVIDQKEIGGPIPDQTRQIEELLKLNIRTAARMGGARRQETSDYPIEALEQLVRNAILHRNYEASTMPTKVYWYSDRIEIINPGGLYGEVTPETIWQNATAYRNPSLAEGLKTLGVVERFGFGLARARQALAENGNPPLAYEFLENFVLFKMEPAQ